MIFGVKHEYSIIVQARVYDFAKAGIAKDIVQSMSCGLVKMAWYSSLTSMLQYHNRQPILSYVIYNAPHYLCNTL
jgi:hypothetical protein